MSSFVTRWLAPKVSPWASPGSVFRRWADHFAEGFQPLSLAGSTSGIVMTAACGAAIVAVALLEALRPGLASLGSLLFLPVLLAVWLLGPAQALAVSALAVVGRLFGYSIAGVDPGTALAEASMIVTLAITARLAARALVDSQQARARNLEQARVLELLAERERIAAKVNDAAVRRLFGLSIQLEAVAGLVDQQAHKHRLEELVAEADGLCSELRGIVFESGTLPAGSPAELGPSASRPTVPPASSLKATRR